MQDKFHTSALVLHGWRSDLSPGHTDSAAAGCSAEEDLAVQSGSGTVPGMFAEGLAAEGSGIAAAAAGSAAAAATVVVVVAAAAAATYSQSSGAGLPSWRCSLSASRTGQGQNPCLLEISRGSRKSENAEASKECTLGADKLAMRCPKHRPCEK